MNRYGAFLTAEPGTDLLRPLPPRPPGYARAAQADRHVVRRIGEAGEVIDGTLFRNCTIIRFDGHDYIFSARAILTMVVVAACNAACRFCSNEITFTPSGPYLTYDERLRRVKDFALLAGVTKIAYTGGEPTLQPQRLYDLMRAMNPGFRRSRLHTNGSGLFKDVLTADGTTRPLLPALIEAGLTGASVSVAHHDRAANEEIMRFKRGWASTPEDALSAVASHRSDAFTPRLSCVMSHDGLHTVADILRYIEWGRALGYRNFIFRSCSAIPEEFEKPTAFSSFNNTNYLPIDPICEQLGRLPFLRRTYRQRKSDSKVDVYQWDDMTIDVDESSEEQDPDRKIRRLNVMTNGIVYTSWIDPLSVLFGEDLAAAEAARRREFGRTG
ncbi:MAG TPA: radical SAM protein [Trebonia sp.]|jgi:molybdenum cofactor biosynthesis enzyme MoaA|nr:radical SAM protein [Trebonia sp.]